MRCVAVPCLYVALLCSVAKAQAAPQGSLHRHTYASARFGEPRECLVYTPPNYTANAAPRYPVLVLLHGAMGAPADWTTKAGVDRALDQLIHEGAAEPMLLVLPSGYGFPDADHRAAQVFGAPPEQQLAWMDALGEALLGEVLPLVEARYAVRRDREGRALAGFSMGGAQALHLGLRNGDQFGWIGAFSSAFPLYGGRWEEALRRRGAAPQLLWLSCGQADLLLGPNRAVAARLQVPLQEWPGGHDDAQACTAFIAFARQLFHTP